MRRRDCGDGEDELGCAPTDDGVVVASLCGGREGVGGVEIITI